MCTYNGATYLPEQLESIASQTLPVDELVVCDDGSSDDTLAILQAFAQKVSFPVQVVRNETNLGSTKNFEKCMLLCRGDILVLCDQDDIWRKDRVEKQVGYLQQHPDKDAVFSDGLMIDDNSQPIGTTLWKEIEFFEEPQQRWQQGLGYEILFNGYVVTGATVALRRSCLPHLLPFPTHIPLLIHDGWIALVLCLQDKIGFINECLISYRMHSSQQVGLGGKLEPVSLRDRLTRDREIKLTPLREKAQELEMIYLHLHNYPNIPAEKLNKLYLRQQHFQRRSSLPPNRLRRIRPVLRDAASGHYRFSSKDWWLPALGDLLE